MNYNHITQKSLLYYNEKEKSNDINEYLQNFVIKNKDILKNDIVGVIIGQFNEVIKIINDNNINNYELRPYGDNVAESERLNDDKKYFFYDFISMGEDIDHVAYDNAFKERQSATHKNSYSKNYKLVLNIYNRGDNHESFPNIIQFSKLLFSIIPLIKLDDRYHIDIYSSEIRKDGFDRAFNNDSSCYLNLNFRIREFLNISDKQVASVNINMKEQDKTLTFQQVIRHNRD